MSTVYIFEPGDVLQLEKSIIYLITNNRLYLSKTMIDNYEYDPDILYVPVGSVEFVQYYAESRGIRIPPNISYPLSIRRFLKRDVTETVFESVPDHMFCKPVGTKVFTGGIKNTITEIIHDNAPVFMSEPIQLFHEYRYYVHNGDIVGYSRYDDHDDDSVPPTEFVDEIINEFVEQPNAYSIDVGYMENNVPVLIECNDAWSLGFYQWGTMRREQYVQMITDRWANIIENQNLGD